jgi:cell division protein FtsB
VRSVFKRSALAITLVVIVFLAWGWWGGMIATQEARRELAQLAQEKSRLEKANQELRREVAALRREREARARVARETLDVAAPGEVLVVLPPAEGAK